MKNLKLMAFVILTLIISIQSCSIRINDDGSRYLKEPERISKFEISDFGKNRKYKSKESIQFQLVNGEIIEKIKSKKEKTWIYVWGSWCTPCIKKIPKLIELDKKDENLNIVFVSEDYDLEALQKILYKSNYDKIAYILDSKTYGTNVKKKPKILNQELCKDCLFQEGFPQNYLYNKEKDIQFYKAGTVDNNELNKMDIYIN